MDKEEASVMKNWMKITILVVILGIFTVAFIMLSKIGNDQGNNGTSSPDPTETSSSLDVVDLFDFNWQDVTKMILRRGDGEIVLTKEKRAVESIETDNEGNEKKVIEEKELWFNPDFDVENSKAEDIAVTANSLTTKRLIDANPSDISIYGLDKPDVTIFITSGGKEYGIEIGNETPTKDGYYVRKTGSTEVYTISSYSAESLKYGKFDIMNRNLYGTNAISVEDIKSLKLIKSGATVFSAQMGSAPTKWQLTEPFEWEVEYSELAQFLNWLYGLRVSKFTEEDAQDLNQYGLDNPKYVFEYTLDGKDYSLKLGNLKDSYYYGMLNDNGTVFTVDSSSLNFVDTPLINIVSRFVYLPSIYDVEKVVIEIDGRTDVMDINTSEDAIAESDFRLNGRKMETDEEVSLFRKYYQGVIGALADKIDLEADPKGDWFARYTYTMKKADPDKIVTVELIPTEDGYGYYLMKNGRYTRLVMSKRKLDDESLGIRYHYKNLMDALGKSNQN